MTIILLNLIIYSNYIFPNLVAVVTATLVMEEPAAPAVPSPHHATDHEPQSPQTEPL